MNAKNTNNTRNTQQTKVVDAYAKKVTAATKKMEKATKQAARNKIVQDLEEARDLAQVSLVTAGMEATKAAAALSALDGKLLTPAKPVAVPAEPKTAKTAKSDKPVKLTAEQKKTAAILDKYVRAMQSASNASERKSAADNARNALLKNDVALMDLDGLLEGALKVANISVSADDVAGSDKPEVADKPAPKLNVPMLHKSKVDGPVGAMWALCNRMNGARRKDVIAAAIKQGIATFTARTQYQCWFKENKASKGGKKSSK